MTPLAPYPSPEARDEALRTATAAAGGEVITLGESREGRPLLGARLGPQPARDRPAVLVTAGIHGPEYIGVAVALGLLARADQPLLRALRAKAALWVVPCLNPDGYARVWAADGRGAIGVLRPNAHGVDLNRNFPLPPGHRRLSLPGAGSLRPGDATYVGPAPLSEPESAAVDRLCHGQHFQAAVDVHSFMGRLIPAHVTDVAAFAVYKRLCARFKAAQPRVRYGRLSSRLFDTFTGELEDHLHHAHGTWAICCETFSWSASFRQHLRAPSLFWRFNPHDPGPWVDNDVPAIAACLEAALELPPASRTRPAAAIGPARL